MTLSELRDNTRSLIDETTPTPVLTNTEIDRFINNTLDYCYSRIISKHESFFATTDSTIDLVNGTESYALPDLDSNNQTRVEHILHVKVAYDGSNFRRAYPIEPIEIVDTNYQSAAYTQNFPRYYLLGNNIYILPTPTANASNAVKLWYIQRPAALSSDTDVPAFSPLYHRFIPYGAAADAVRKERDVQDFSLLQEYDQQFKEGLTAMLEDIQPRDSSYPATVIDIEGIPDYPPELYVPPGSMSL